MALRAHLRIGHPAKIAGWPYEGNVARRYDNRKRAGENYPLRAKKVGLWKQVSGGRYHKTIVAPDLIRGPAAFLLVNHARKESGIPDQVRDDE